MKFPLYRPIIKVKNYFFTGVLMRVTNQFLYTNFIQDHQKAQKKMSELSEQLSSGRKISAGYQDSSIYAETMRLESEQNRQRDIQERTQKASMIASASDSALAEFNDALTSFKTKLITAANGTMNPSNLEAIATELEQQKAHMINVANTQVDGQYLFAGTAVNTMPIDAKGNYHGNGTPLKVMTGEGIDLFYSIDGLSLFFGEEPGIHKSISTNVALQKIDPADPTSKGTATETTTIRELFGDETLTQGYFYLSGIQRDGGAFKQKIELSGEKTVADLMTQIGVAFGNEGEDLKVDVGLIEGRISVTDKKPGASKISFSLVGSDTDADDLSALSGSRLIRFVKSGMEGVTTEDEALQNDQFYFKKEGNRLTGNVPLLADGKVADKQTLLKDIANGSLDGKTFEMKLTDTDGNAHTLTLEIRDQTTFSINGNRYEVKNAAGGSTKADEMTLGQLQGVIAMALSGSLPADSTADGYEQALREAKRSINVSVGSDGVLEIENFTNSEIKFAMYDTEADRFDTPSPTISFNANNAITTEDSHIDFFKELDQMIEAVRSGALYPDANQRDPRNPGLENALGRLDKISAHFQSKHTQIGTMQNSLQSAQDRASSLEMNIIDLKSKTVDTDIGETIMKLNQLSLNYQAILSTVSKINSLTLLNYLK
ncbi:MAG: hypothetical protein B6D59_02080 [Campylobacteraceae bacterium 4484_4]|nr:MAG: hypothetical protein B6D59_02080 [Campylobacteraceae bacterium 4484_4]